MSTGCALLRCFSAAILAVSLRGCLGKNLEQGVKKQEEKVGQEAGIIHEPREHGPAMSIEYIGRVDQTKLIPNVVPPNRKHFDVTVTISTILANPGGAPVVRGQSLHIFVHSIAKTFYAAEGIVGKSYRIRYLGPFADPYAGRVQVEPAKPRDPRVPEPTD